MTAQQMFNQGVSYTYDDVIMHPGHIDFGAHEVRARVRARADAHPPSHRHHRAQPKGPHART